MFNLFLCLFSLSVVPVGPQEPYQFRRDIAFKAEQNLTAYANGLYNFRLTYIFYTDLSYNDPYSYVYRYNGFNLDLGIYDYNSELIYSYNESYYEEVNMYISNNSYNISYDFYNSDEYSLKITFDYGSSSTNWYVPLDDFSSNYFNFQFDNDTILNWTSITESLIPLVIYGDSYDLGYYNGYQAGEEIGNRDGYNNGYNDGYSDAQTDDSIPSVIFGGVLNIAMIPVNFFLAVLNFEVFGINIGGFVTGIMTIAVVIIILGVIFGGRHGPSGGPSGGGKK